MKIDRTKAATTDQMTTLTMTLFFEKKIDPWFIEKISPFKFYILFFY